MSDMANPSTLAISDAARIQFTEALGGEIKKDIVKARALRFMKGGKESFFARVSHPGIAAKPFMGSSLAENESNIREQLQQALDAELNRD
jgi:hypothetical protein